MLPQSDQILLDLRLRKSHFPLRTVSSDNIDSRHMWEKTAMTPINGIARNGRIEIKAPIGFSVGTEVRIWLDKTQCDDDGPMSPEEIERTLEAMSQVEPLVLTDAERIEWQKALDDQKALEQDATESRTAKTMGQWE